MVAKRKGKTFLCLVCGEQIYVEPSRVGIKKYCSLACKIKGMKKPRITKCVQCGKIINEPPSQIRLKNRIYCSRKCSGIAHKCKVVIQCATCGKDINILPCHYKNSISKIFYCSDKCKKKSLKIVTMFCRRCGKQFTVSPFASRYRKYCSKECFYNTIRDTRIKTQCKTCGKPLTRTPFQIKNSKNSFCSRECLAKYHLPRIMNISKIENLVAKYLDWHGIEYQRQKFISDRDKRKRGYFIDFYLKNKNIFIEVNGMYWHADQRKYKRKNLTVEQKQRVNRDNDLKYYCKENNINLITIWETDINSNPSLAIATALKNIIKIKSVNNAFYGQPTLAASL